MKLKYNLLGPKYGKDVKKIAQYISKMPIDKVEEKIKGGADIELEDVIINGKKVVLSADEFFIESKPLGNIAVEEEDDYIAAFNTTLSKELLQEGMVRDFIRHIQNIRKEAEFNVLDRVVVCCHTSDEWKEALTKHLDYIKKEVLADTLEFDEKKREENRMKIGDREVWVSVKRV